MSVAGVPSVADRVGRVAVGGVTLALAVLGVALAVAEHLHAARSLDEALLAAAYARAAQPRFAEGERWLPEEDGTSPVHVALWPDQEVPASPEALQAAVASESTRASTAGELRMVLLPTEPFGARLLGEPKPPHPHAVVVAWAPAVRLADGALPLLGLYLPLAAVIALLVGLAQQRAVRSELAALERTVNRLGRVARLGGAPTVPEEGPNEVREVIRAVNDLLGRLEAAHGAQSAFAATAAHELRTPVAVLRGELELLLRRDRSADDLREGLGRLLEDVARLGRLVDALLAMVRIDAGQAERGRERERVSALVHGAMRSQLQPDQAARVIVRIEADRELWVSVTLVELAIGNLLRNAFVHGAEPVTLRAFEGGDGVVIEVSDAGPGVPEGDREAFFTRFAHGRTGGLGLGLPLARDVARRHGGDCVLDAAPGGGARARLTLSGASHRTLTEG